MNEVGSKLEKTLKLLVSAQDETFRVYKDRKVIGDLIFKSLIARQDGTDSAGNDAEGFYLTQKEDEVGLMSQLYGIVGLISLINRYGVVPSAEDVKKIKKGVSWIMAYLEKYGYDLSPYLDDKVNEDFFQNSNTKGKKVSYVGARTWAFSMFVSLRKLHLNGIIDFGAEMEKIMSRIKGNVQFFINEVIRVEDEPVGYGYANGCEEPSLFFTYSVVEAFADFDDNCLGSDGGLRDEELLEYMNRDNTDGVPIEKQFTDICMKMGDLAWEYFGGVLKNKFFSDKFDKNFRIISEEEILNSSRSSVLFNSLYVIFTLFYSYKNSRQDQSAEQNKEIMSSMSLGLQLIQNFYDELTASDKDSIVDKHIISFDQKHRIDRFSKELNDASIQASSLLPMLAKANNLIAFYNYKFPQQKMGVMFDKMLEAKLEGEWLWENRKYDLLSTERYLEAVADFYDYYDKYERRYAEKSTSDAELRAKLGEEVRKVLEPKIILEQSKKLNAKHKQEMDAVLRDAAARYPIETQLNQRMETVANEKALKIMCDMLNSLAKFNSLSDEEKSRVSLSPDEQKLQSALQNYISSFIAVPLKVASLKSGVESAKLKKAGESDLIQTLTAFFEFIAQNNVDRQGSGKLSLKEIFKIIENSKE